ncbi:GM19901 [Drosophila sechellia]|uniref:GM19901 n=1 Tax=Drosophila sechellia TaxID=7238 RepID=B4HNR0_DROSE|nr:GM19901 [Drosophila sechellia]
MASPTWRLHTPCWINGSLDRGLSILTFVTQLAEVEERLAPISRSKTSAINKPTIAQSGGLITANDLPKSKTRH